MKKELIASGKTVEAALASGLRELGVDITRVTYEILEAPKKGFLGFGEAPAKVKIFFSPGPEDAAIDFIRQICDDLDIHCDVELTRDIVGNGDRLIRITGEEAGLLIGHHGDTMDALQCLVNIAANRGRSKGEASEEDGEEDEEGGDGYVRLAVDIENYRAKREETLRRLARSMASRVQKSGRSITLEPMPPYERRIIHSEIQDIRGVTTKSIGVDDGRKVVIYPEDGPAPVAPARKSRNRRPRGDKPSETVAAEKPDEE